MSTNELIKVCFAFDNNYIDQAIVTIGSLLSHTKSEIGLFILDFGITVEKKHKLKNIFQQYKNAHISFVNCEHRFSNFHERGYLTRAIYGRFLIPELFPNEKKIIYSDVDVMFKDDIKRLFAMDLKGKTLAACPEIFDNINGCNVKKSERLGLENPSAYFSSGLLVIDCTLWNKREISKKLEYLYEKKKEVLVCPDQDLLNMAFHKDYAAIDNKWCVVNQLVEDYQTQHNFLPLYILNREVGIRHFNGKNKPWLRLPRLVESHSQLGTREYWRYLYKFSLIKELPLFNSLCFKDKVKVHVLIALSHLID